VLGWDYPLFYASERESSPRRRWRIHPRIEFELDDQHPSRGSQHQKIVVVDDSIAFVGGIDLTLARWDTPEHPASDPRRRDTSGNVCGPIHDAMAMVEGDAARAVGELARRRWHAATGKSVDLTDGEGELWPEPVTADLDDVIVGITRTCPAFAGRPQVREIEALHLASIARARRFIYAETQYLTSERVVDGLVHRLAEPDGPEVVLVVPWESSGWLEELTMGVLRSRMVRKLHEADRHHRFRVFSPVVDGDTHVHVHGKLMIIDDAFVRVGSANLAGRSMGIDSECDVAIEAAGDPRVGAAVSALRRRLLSEHLGVSPQRIAEAEERCASLVGAIDQLRGGTRTLVTVDGRVPEWMDALVPRSADPEPTEGESRKRAGPRGKTVLLVLVAAAGVLAFAWLAPGSWTRPDRWVAIAATLRSTPGAALLVISAHVVAGVVFVPLTAVIVATALAFDPLTSFTLAFSGSMASAAVSYWIGRAAGSRLLARFPTPARWRVMRMLSRPGVLSIAAVRMLPVAPFTLVNLAGGAAGIPPRAFLLGSALGLLPGIAAATALGAHVARAVVRPTAVNVGLAIAVAAGFGAIAFAAARSLQAREQRPADA
jgi:phosphatidylserine/phosphatidylglycerophosphate/cardiolipin synthase-like enzyme/uncharacterized membrane protein YdjX (TVP38/TMEM64 family)